ncbi:MAG: HAD hydrolase-like protein [Candidatus Magasanikbacteria bacterium]|jgi:HAD superfamily hydrolase (TIGR01509 family)|nr:HAD hydrolase-like protein [Candidatus Magasanikbacteria bacterium]MBT4221266.1 HAD hydrolase-like protein [Candidatus Magasanikbacteria bacterium]MBT4350412.1 HAD hydrolase-like protein [Candidatus Magasanikbacteria bacterium]MBT4542041.1 HAD hydrolase-like protein [Candidatus Magasanikbacteria bacterium]MBT6253390.1 HAD hydrolase-like protein [Candidatus Magasanikbacteria bacterium]
MNITLYQIIFDWGGVLAPDDSLLAAEHLSKKYKCDYEELRKVLWDEEGFSEGKNEEGYFKKILEKFPIPKEEIIEWKNKALPNDTFTFCHKLKKKGYTVHLLSDQMQWRADFIRNNFDLQCFDQIMFSSEIGHIKKEKEAFLCMINAGRIDLKKAVFVDDSKCKIAVAKEVGLDAILYINLPDLKKQLHKRGITI